MVTIRAHKIRLYPNDKQSSHLVRACGIKRFVYNWGLEERKRLYSEGVKISGFGLKKKFNAIKHKDYPFVTTVSKCVADNALIDLDRSFSNFFREHKKGNRKVYPRFKKKGGHDSFRVDNDKVTVKDKSLRVPVLGYVRMSECLRFSGKIMSVTVSRTADRWFASIQVAVELPSETQGSGKCGLDIGIKHLGVTSGGEVYDNPNRWTSDLNRLRRLSTGLSRKQKGSANRRKAKGRLALYWLKFTDRRKDAVHKMTSDIASKYGTVYIEDLDVVQMMSDGRLARKIMYSTFSEIRRQLSYKTVTEIVDRFYPSTQLCPSCGRKNKLKLSDRVYRCKCGYGPVDRDLHAAQNILRAGCPEVKPVKTVEDLTYKAAVCEAGNVLKTYNRPGGGLCNFL